ncbi:hypothetical protein GpartN1_g3537.t1 [Galdieria partita]|uniref:RWP-RK domain-containing protein n=1 Tax=Galdieria partita TaxID=83374 RepID=A0A9C7PXM4_9RHOD|nr:hypothetical protein GpartN1_g3537.t1 [Galdieria partita]
MVKPKTRPNIPFGLLQQHFDKTMSEASSELGVSVSYLKSACRFYGINRWPYRKIKNLKTLVHFLSEEGRGKGAGSTNKEEIERLNSKIRSLLHSHLEEFQTTVKSLEKSSQGRSSVAENGYQEERLLDEQTTCFSLGTLEQSTYHSNIFSNQELQSSIVEREQNLEMKRLTDASSCSLVPNNELGRSSSFVSSLTETHDVGTNSALGMLEWNLPALAIHLGVDGIHKLGPSKLVQLAHDYYYKPLPCSHVHHNQVQSNGKYLKDQMETLNQRLKMLQEEKQQLENTHACLARTFREASLRELRK